MVDANLRDFILIQKGTGIPRWMHASLGNAFLSGAIPLGFPAMTVFKSGRAPLVYVRELSPW